MTASKICIRVKIANRLCSDQNKHQHLQVWFVLRISQLTRLELTTVDNNVFLHRDIPMC